MAQLSAICTDKTFTIVVKAGRPKQEDSNYFPCRNPKKSGGHPGNLVTCRIPKVPMRMKSDPKQIATVTALRSERYPLAKTRGGLKAFFQPKI